MLLAPEQKVKFLRPTWAEVNLSAVDANLTRLKAIAGPRCRVMFVVKANAYGHGADRLALFALEHSLCDSFGVSSIEEGLALRKSGITLPVLILGSIYPFEGFEYALRAGLSVTVASLDAAKELGAVAAKTGMRASCHIKVDTGMGRIGMRRPAAVEAVKRLAGAGAVSLDGIYTHFAAADNDPDYTRLQLKHFEDTLKECQALGLSAGLRHAANSCAAVAFPETRFDMIRPGAAAYGILGEFVPALALKSRVVFLKDVKTGSSLGYDRGYKCKRQTKVATIPVGYGDGYPRKLSNRADVLIRGARCRILGNISMDMLMADVSHLSQARVGDEVVLVGRQGDNEITACELAGLAGTIPYEIVTSISSRVPRIYCQ